MKILFPFLIGIIGVAISLHASLSLELFLAMSAVWIGFVLASYVLGFIVFGRNLRGHHE